MDGGFYSPPTESGGLRYPVMSFTGLLDRNGTEIFEGDLIERKSRVTGKSDGKIEVYFDYKCGWFAVRGFSVGALNPILSIILKAYSDVGTDYEVVGNIYET